MASFLSLPYEAREEVYRYCYDGLTLVGKTNYPYEDSSRVWSWRCRRKLEFVCKKIRAECIPVRTALTTLVVPAIMLHRDRHVGRMTLIPQGLRRKLTSLEITDLTLSSPSEKVDVSALASLNCILVRRKVEIRDLKVFVAQLLRVAKSQDINAGMVVQNVKHFYRTGRWSDHGLTPTRIFRLHLTILNGNSKTNVCFA